VNRDGAHGLGGAADFITSYDFDGDGDASNNWDNASSARASFAAHAYFTVVETSSHWFVTYLFFHPRDWSSRFLETEHENDAEGLLLAIARDGTRFGGLRAAVTVSHADFYSYVPARSAWTSGREDVDGELRLQSFHGVLHPVTAQQAETHALKGCSEQRCRPARTTATCSTSCTTYSSRVVCGNDEAPRSCSSATASSLAMLPAAAARACCGAAATRRARRGAGTTTTTACRPARWPAIQLA
jgi:hypothetical protein